MFIVLLIIVLTAFVGLSVRFYMAASAGRFEANLDSNAVDTDSLTRTQWWANRRIKYNIGLIVAGFTAFIAYAVLGGLLIAPYDNDFEVTLFTMFFQGVGYLFIMFVANLFYNLGPLVDKHYNKDNRETFRQQLYNLGFWFSVGLPFLIPALIVVEYFIRFAGNK
jgi:hypothetical protein